MLSSPFTDKGANEVELDLLFKALSDHTRRELISHLADGAMKVTDLAKPFAMSLPAVSKHLRVLEKAGLVTRTVTGRVHSCSLNALPLKSAEQWLAHYHQFWGETLDALSDYV